LSLRNLLLLGLLILVTLWWFRADVIVVSPDAFESELLAQLPDRPLEDEPVQIELTDVPALHWNGIQLQPRALLGLESRVLGTRNYRFGRETEVSTLDVALGWGRMADPEIVSRFSISQSGRFYFWRAKELPIPAAEVVRSSANMHMIAANEAVRRELGRLDAGDRVRLHGVLLDLQWSDGGYWKTSLTREDTGAGACEIVWVHSLERLP
jgi:hypothetical protein